MSGHRKGKKFTQIWFVCFQRVRKMGIYWTVYTSQWKSAVRIGKPMCFLHTMHECSLSYGNDLMISGAKCSSPSCGFKLNLVLSFHFAGSGAILHCAAQARKGFLTQRQTLISNGYKRCCNCTSSFFPPTGITTNEHHWKFFWALTG